MKNLKSLFSSNIIGYPEKIKKIRSDFFEIENQMIRHGYGVSLVAQSLSPISRQQQIDENLKTREKAMQLAVALYARYMVLRGIDNGFFSFVAANDCHRTLFNVGCEDKNLTDWLWDGSTFFFLEEDSNQKLEESNMPVILREQLLSILQ